MPGHRIYWLDKDDHIIAADNLIADADEQARAAAEARLGGLRQSRYGTVRDASRELSTDNRPPQRSRPPSAPVAPA